MAQPDPEHGHVRKGDPKRHTGPAEVVADRDPPLDAPSDRRIDPSPRPEPKGPPPADPARVRPDRASGNDDVFVSWHRISGAGIEFAVAIGLMTAAGYGLDQWLGTFPWLTVVGVFVGFAVGLTMLIRMARKMF